jgi:zinc transporter ZupT
MVDDAFWSFTVSPGPTLERLGRATVTISYPWVRAEPHVIRLITPTGTTFEGEVLAATLTPQPGLREFGAYALLGIYVGIIPVVLGMLWFPAMKRLGRRGLGAVLALTLGLLIFLLIDTLLEAFEIAAELPGVFQGVPLALFAALLTWLALVAVGSRRGAAHVDPARQRLYVASLIALGIGLHNFGEGLAIGAAFALGEAALGSFLILGFTLHNVTEGIGIAAPVTRDQPGWQQFGALALVAGAPAILGAWIGGFAFSPLLATLFLGIGAGAIWQVIIEVGGLLRRDAEKDGLPLVSWLNVGALLAGIAVMYLTAFLVK